MKPVLSKEMHKNDFPQPLVSVHCLSFHTFTFKFRVATVKTCSLRREAVVKLFLSPFGWDLGRSPYVFLKSKLSSITLSFILKDNIIEYVCFWGFNSIIMRWNKWLVLRKSVIMALNNISHFLARLALFVNCAYYIALFNTATFHTDLLCRGMSLASSDEHPGFDTHRTLCDIGYFLLLQCFVFLLSFSHNG